MPELPEVEVFKRYFDETSLHKRIIDVSIYDSRLLKTSVTRVRQALLENEFDRTQRWGKYLFAHVVGGEWLTLHFGLTGQLRSFMHKSDRPHNVALEIDFVDKSILVMTSKRRLGAINITESPQHYIKINGLGVDALQIDCDRFQTIFYIKRGSVKGALMDQSTLAGVGNVYADEILYQTKVHPLTNVNDIEPDKIAEIWQVMRSVLNTAVDYLTRGEELPDDWFIHCRQIDANCPRCNSEIERISVLGRSSYLCPACQHL